MAFCVVFLEETMIDAFGVRLRRANGFYWFRILFFVSFSALSFLSFLVLSAGGVVRRPQSSDHHPLVLDKVVVEQPRLDGERNVWSIASGVHLENKGLFKFIELKTLLQI